MSDYSFGPPKTVLSSVYEITPEALEEFAQWLEQRGIRTPVSQVIGYKRDRLASMVESTGQTIANGTETTQTFNLTTKDEQKLFNGTDTFTLPFNGIYLAGGYLVWTSNVNGGRAHFLKQNGVVRAEDWRGTGITAPTAANTISGPLFGLKGDLVTMSVMQDSTANLDTLAATFWIALLNAY